MNYMLNQGGVTVKGVIQLGSIGKLKIAIFQHL